MSAAQEFLNWSVQGADEIDISGWCIKDTGVTDVNVRYVNYGDGDEFRIESSDKQYVGIGEPYAEFSGAPLGGVESGSYSTTTLAFDANTTGYSDEVENVRIGLNDIGEDRWTDRVAVFAITCKALPSVL